MKKIYHKCKNGGKRYILFIDEIMVDFDCLDFSVLAELEELLKEIDLLWAFNPAAFDMSYDYNEVKFPTSIERALVKRLKTKYRNSFQIGNLLLHVNGIFVGLKEKYKCLPASEDNPLDASILSIGNLPLWIDCPNPNTTIEQVLDFLMEENHVDYKPFTILHSVDEEDSRTSLQNWCAREQLDWKVSSFFDMTGSEADNVIALVEDETTNLEVFSRARKELVVITMR